MLIADELVLRTEHDDSVTIIAPCVLGENKAFGAARVRVTELEAAKTSLHVRFARARAGQTLAIALTSTPEASLDAAMLGVDTLGELYKARSSAAIPRTRC